MSRAIARCRFYVEDQSRNAEFLNVMKAREETMKVRPTSFGERLLLLTRIYVPLYRHLLALYPSASHLEATTVTTLLSTCTFCLCAFKNSLRVVVQLL